MSSQFYDVRSVSCSRVSWSNGLTALSIYRMLKEVPVAGSMKRVNHVANQISACKSVGVFSM